MKIFILIIYIQTMVSHAGQLISVPHFQDLQSCNVAGEQVLKTVNSGLQQYYTCVEGWRK